MIPRAGSASGRSRSTPRPTATRGIETLADEALAIGAAPPRESYLRSDRIIEAALATGRDAIHPGYGFLSENAAFAEACAAAGLVFIGPPAEAIRTMGSQERRATHDGAAAGVPVVPGYHGEDQADGVLAREAARDRLPGADEGVGRRRRQGHAPRRERAELREAALAAAARGDEAFGDERLLLEKCLERPRHIEIQVFCDSHGNVVHLFERDCSIQRRHQKIIEEAPSPGLDRRRRERDGQGGRRGGARDRLRGAGTVEFMRRARRHASTSWR